MAKKPIKVTEVVLRDAHQSLLATRMTMDEMRPILPEMDKINYFSVECWGGATFDSCIRFLDEDPWERLRILRKELPHQKLQMLFRGQNMLGYRPYADDAVEYFVQKSVANGIDVIRIFDALNDPRNLQTARPMPRPWRRWAPTPSASRTWPACSPPIPAMSWSRS